MDYQDRLKEHLSTYKKSRLGVDETGSFMGLPYSHILPDELNRLNIIETFRSEFWSWKSNCLPSITLHSYFAHLNSSQAMAFNLLYPAFPNQIDFMSLVGIPMGVVKNWEFEKTPLYPNDPHREGTNFDFHVAGESGQQVFFELKLSENKFGKASSTANYEHRLISIYNDRLTGKIDSSYLDIVKFRENYQLLRNLSYIDQSTKDQLVILFPKGNKVLVTQANQFHNDLDASFKARVHIVYLEDLCKKLITQAVTSGMQKLVTHYELFQEKYVI